MPKVKKRTLRVSYHLGSRGPSKVSTGPQCLDSATTPSQASVSTSGEWRLHQLRPMQAFAYKGQQLIWGHSWGPSKLGCMAPSHGVLTHCPSPSWGFPTQSCPEVPHCCGPGGPSPGSGPRSATPGLVGNLHPHPQGPLLVPTSLFGFITLEGKGETFPFRLALKEGVSQARGAPRHPSPAHLSPRTRPQPSPTSSHAFQPHPAGKEPSVFQACGLTGEERLGSSGGPPGEGPGEGGALGRGKGAV